jgi:hypothetical protein
MKKNQIISGEVINGVEVSKTGAKWQLSALLPSGATFTTFQSGRLGKEKLTAIAKAISSSVKRNFAGVITIDPMAQGQIRNILAAKTFKGTDFSNGVPNSAVNTQNREFRNPQFRLVSIAGA